MAVTYHGFSIRDYTSKMRSVDVFKCWPFASPELTPHQLHSWLPPITLPKSRWWSDELARMRSSRECPGGEDQKENRPEKELLSPADHQTESADSDKFLVAVGSSEEDKFDMVCPVCRNFNAATLTAVNAHIDGCLAQTMREERRQMRKPKSKAPKKRSIAEIFELDKEEEPPPTEIETVLRFWPFDDDADEVSITVTKFRWLSRRLEALRSNSESAKSDGINSNSAEEKEKLEMVCPVCRVFNAETVTAVNAHIEGCLSKALMEERWRMRKPCSNPKPKTPKKRSIAEILTVAPQINAAGDGKLVTEVEEEDEMDGEDYDKSGSIDATIKNQKSTNKNVKEKLKKVLKKKTKVGKRGVVSPNNKNKKMKRKKKKKKESLFSNKFTATKEDASKHNMRNPENISKKLKGTIWNQTDKLDDFGASSAHEKKSDLKILSEEKKEKVKTCDSDGKQQNPVSPISGTLKNHKHISGSNSSGCDNQDDTEESHCDVQVPSSDGHVGFSAKDFTLSPEKRNPFDETVINLPSDALASSFEEDQSSGSYEGTRNLEVNRNEDKIAINADKVAVQNLVANRNNAPGQVDLQNFSMPCTSQEKAKHSVEKSESLSKAPFCDNNFQRFDRGNMTTLHFSPYADVSGRLSVFQAGRISGIDKQVYESEAYSTTGKFTDHLKDPTFHSSAVNSNANTRTYLEPSLCHSSSYDKGNERPKFPSDAYGDNEGQALGGRMWHDTFSAPSWGKGSVRNNYMEQNFFGLPLNSHGELINFSSSGKVGMKQPETSCTLRSSLSGLPVNNILHQSSQEYLSFGERHVVQKTLRDQVNSFPHYPARLGVTELHGREKGDIYKQNSDRCSDHYVQLLDSEFNSTRSPFIEQNKRDKMPNHKRHGMVPQKESSGLILPSSNQPTMRLMGTDVPIGRSSKENQQFVGRDLWAEEESRTRHFSDDAAQNISLLGKSSKYDWASGSQFQISADNALQSVKFQSSLGLQSNFWMKGPNSEFHDQLNSHLSQHGSLEGSRNGTSNLHHITQTPTSCAMYNRVPQNLPEQFIAAKPQGHSFQSQVLPPPWNSSQPNGEPIDRMKHHNVTNSALGSPFSQSVVEEQAKSSSFNKSYRSSPPWLYGPTHERVPGTSSNNNYPPNTWGYNFTTPSANQSTEVLCPPNSMISHWPKTALLSPASIVQPPPAPFTPISNPPSAINSSCRNIIKVTDKVKDDITTYTTSRKRPASNLVDLAKPNKLPDIEVQENSSRMPGLARETSSTYVQRNTNTRAVELDLRMGARSKFCQNEAQNLTPRSNHGFDSIDLNGMVISGPVKLSPGAKHILRPSQNMDQDNSRPIHSAIPIAANSDSGRDLELQRNLTKIYRF